MTPFSRPPSARTYAASTPGALFAGLVAATVALGVGELVAGLLPQLTSPVEAVAGSAIDLAPGPVERWAIAVLGSNDKPALVIGILLLNAVTGALLGLVARRRITWGATGIGVFGLVGVAATLHQGSGPVGGLPSALAAVAGIAALAVLLRGSQQTGSGADGTPDGRPEAGGAGRAGAGDRRAFLRLSGSLAAAAVVAAATGRLAASRFSAAASRAVVALPRSVRSLPPLPRGVSVGVPGVAPFVTPEADFYRVDTALVVPQVPVEDWRLRVTGMVDRPLEFSYDELLDMALVEADITLTCVSNTVGGDLVGHARWTGIPLADLLESAGVAPDANQVVGRSVDGYTCGFPVAEVAPRGSLVALGMNGEPLPIERGFPARLVTPGLYGYVSATKWLTEIELTTFEAVDQYWVPRGWDARAPIKTMSRIDVPRSLEPVPAGPVDVAGVAWAQTRGISRVEVRIDDGPWNDAELATALNDNSWRQWRFRWEDAREGTHRITVRATDGEGDVQPQERTEPFPNGASGWMTLAVTVDPAA